GAIGTAINLACPLTGPLQPHGHQATAGRGGTAAIAAGRPLSWHARRSSRCRIADRHAPLVLSVRCRRPRTCGCRRYSDAASGWLEPGHQPTGEGKRRSRTSPALPASVSLTRLWVPVVVTRCL